MMISAPSPIACCAAACAFCGLPASSFTSNWMFGFLNSASAISAAFFIDSAATPALPGADSGRMSATRIWPVPMAAPGCASAGCGGGASVVPRLPRFVLVQAASTAAAASDTPRRQQIAHDAHQRSPSTCRRLPASPHGRRQFWLSPNHNRAFCPAKVKPMKSKDEFGAGVVINSPLGYTISHGQR